MRWDTALKLRRISNARTLQRCGRPRHGWTSTPTVHSSNTEPLGMTTIDAFPLDRKRQGIRMKHSGVTVQWHRKCQALILALTETRKLSMASASSSTLTFDHARSTSCGSHQHRRGKGFRLTRSTAATRCPDPITAISVSNTSSSALGSPCWSLHCFRRVVTLP